MHNDALALHLLVWALHWTTKQHQFFPLIVEAVNDLPILDVRYQASSQSYIAGQFFYDVINRSTFPEENVQVSKIL